MIKFRNLVYGLLGFAVLCALGYSLLNHNSHPQHFTAHDVALFHGPSNDISKIVFKAHYLSRLSQTTSQASHSQDFIKLIDALKHYAVNSKNRLTKKDSKNIEKIIKMAELYQGYRLHKASGKELSKVEEGKINHFWSTMFGSSLQMASRGACRCHSNLTGNTVQ